MCRTEFGPLDDPGGCIGGIIEAFLGVHNRLKMDQT